MPLKSDFDKMTLDELTPIVSMRPGKEYTKDELRAARLAFMEKLGCANPEIESEEEPEISAETESEEPAALEPITEESAVPEPIADEPVSTETFAEETEEPAPEVPEITDEAPSSAQTVLPEEPVAEVPTLAPSAPVLEETETVAAETEKEELPEENKTEDAPAPSESEEFIMKTDSRLARFLYLLYAYFLLPLLAVEAISLLVASVGTCVAAADTPYIIINVLCAAVYAMIISLAWHQFLSRTSLGLHLNRTLICVCIIRGFLMLLSGQSMVWGIVFIALSVLFLIYFIGYDTMFTVKSQKKQRVR